MHRAAHRGNVDSIKTLAELGADLNTEDKCGNYFHY